MRAFQRCEFEVNYIDMPVNTIGLISREPWTRKRFRHLVRQKRREWEAECQQVLKAHGR